MNQIVCNNIDEEQWLKTWLEVFDLDWNTDFNWVYQKINEFLLQRNEKKYGSFLNVLKFVPLIWKILWTEKLILRTKLFYLTQYSMRILDDFCDDDLLSEIDIKTKINIVRNIERWEYSDIPLLKDFILEIRIVTQELWIEGQFQEILNYIIKSVTYDFHRSVDSNPYRNQKDLSENFDFMDIDWTIGWMALILWIDRDLAIKLLRPLWLATRKTYNFNDFVDDISKKLINISIEDIEKYNISENDFQSIANMDLWNLKGLSEWVKWWIKKEVVEAEELLVEHNNTFWIKNILLDNGGLVFENKWKIRNRVNNIIMLGVFYVTYIKEINNTLHKVNQEVISTIN